MNRVCIIAAGGQSQRTGLGMYTSKALLPLCGKSLLGHQIDFARRSGCRHVVVICRVEHAKKIALAILDAVSPEEAERGFVAIVVGDRPTGWAGEISRAANFIIPEDEVLLISCDNYHDVNIEWLASGEDAFFTYVNWTDSEHAPSTGPVLARVDDVWVERSGKGHVGDFFAGYVIVRGQALLGALRDLPFVDGKKEMTTLLAMFVRGARTRTIPYDGVYTDVADIPALARLDARLRGDSTEGELEIGAGVLLHTEGRVLLTERADGRGWCPPGGLVDVGESFAEAAARETKEEIGIRVDLSKLRLLGVYPCQTKIGGPGATVVFSYVFADEEGIGRYLIRQHKNVEVKNVDWFTREQIVQLQIPFNLGRAVADYYEGKELDCR